MQNSFSLISAIARGVWFIEPSLAEAYYPIAELILQGKSVDHLVESNTKEKTQVDIKFSNRLEEDNYWRSDRSQFYAINPVTGFKTIFFDEAQPNSVAVIPYDGVTMRFDYCGAIGLETLEKIASYAANHTNISSAVFVLRTPGGSVDYLKEVTDSIAALPIPKVGLFQTSCCSAGMYLSSGFNYKVAENEFTMVGSIGAMLSIRDSSAYLKKEGIINHEVYADGSEKKNLEFRELVKGNYEPVKSKILNPFREDFKAVMLKYNSKLQPDSIVFTGETFMAKQGLELGLVDALGNLNTAIELAHSMARENNNYSKSNTNMFGTSFKAITALKGKAADAITEEDLTAANAELKEKGVEGVMVVNASVIAAAEAQAQDLEAAIGAKNKAEGLLTAANASVKTLETKVQEQEQTIAELNKKLNADGGEAPINTDEKDKNIHETQGGFKPTPVSKIQRD